MDVSAAAGPGFFEAATCDDKRRWRPWQTRSQGRVHLLQVAIVAVAIETVNFPNLNGFPMKNGGSFEYAKVY